MKALVLAACLAAFALVLPAAAAERFVRVDLAIDLENGSLSGDAEAPDGGMMLIRVERPPLARADAPFEGYIGPEGALLPLSAGWLPPLPADADGWRVSVTTPAGYLAVPYPGGSVERSAEGAVARFELNRVTARAPLVVGPYEMAERRAGEVTIRTFFTAANAGQAEAYLDAATEAVETLAAKIGPYPYDAFAVVETPLPVGLGYPGFTLVSGRILPLPFMRGRSLWHEVSHVWWGNGVLVDYANGNWAEGFAVFFADYALAERDGAAAAREMRYDWLLEYDALPPDEDAPLHAFTSKSHGGAQAIGYGKAAMTLHMLRRKHGAAAFDAGVARFWRDNQGKVAGWADVEAAFAATSGQDLSGFFDRWIDEPGAAPADPSDADYHVFRHLAASERILTLRLPYAGDGFEIKALEGAPANGDALAAALAPLGTPRAGGTSVYVGSPAALKAALGRAPPESGIAAIWAVKDAAGEPALAIAAQDLDAVRALAARGRHYGRWSWLVVGEGGRPKSGRWPSGS